MQESFYAKSAISKLYGRRPYVREHLLAVAEQAAAFAAPFNRTKEAYLAGLFHDFGKYSEKFQRALDLPRNEPTNLDHAVCGATLLWLMNQKNGSLRDNAWKAVIEVVNGHHDGLLEYERLENFLNDIIHDKEVSVNAGKRPALCGIAEYKEAFKNGFPDFKRPKLSALPEKFTQTDKPDTVGSMLYSRMLFSCLVDADYSVSACDSDPHYLERTTNDFFDPESALVELHAYHRVICAASGADSGVNRIRDDLFAHCGKEGERMPEGLFTLSAPTGTGKTLALLHFALRHCSGKHAALFPEESSKRRIILVLPFLTLAEQSEDIYRKIFLSEGAADSANRLLIDHSQSGLPDEARDLASRWSVPVIITTTVKFFESLFSNRPTDCRKLHNIANSVILFDEAQSLPADVTPCTLRAVNELCQRYHCTMVFSTATQPDFQRIPNLSWKPQEILPEKGALSQNALFSVLRRVRVDWRLGQPTSLDAVAAEMSQQDSVCCIVNLRKHARKLYAALRKSNADEGTFFLTTDLCPAHRRAVVRDIKERLALGKRCRLVATQCIEAGVDLDFDVMCRALAPLESIIQAVGRCNRGGRLPNGGQAVVFIPDEEGRLYPDNWYGNAAEMVAELLTHYGTDENSCAFDIDNPAHVQEYYKRLFQEAHDRAELRKALEERDFAETDRQYKLISKQGRCVIVPYEGESALYESVCKEARESGLTNGLIRRAAPITVNTFEPEPEGFAERLYFPRRRGEPEKPSDYYLLRPQCKGLYAADMGLQFQPLEDNDQRKNASADENGLIF